MEDREACEECKTKCLWVHGKKIDPSPTVITFHKLLYAKYNFSKYLYLPRKVSQIIPVLVAGQSCLFEDSNGQQWQVMLGNKNGTLAFEKGWDKFYADHGLREGYTVAFHYIMDLRFVVQIIDNTGFEKLKFPIAKGEKRKRSNINGNNDADGKREHKSDNSTKKLMLAVCGTPDPETETHNQPMSKDRPSTSLVISGEANKTQSDPISKNNPSILGSRNSAHQLISSAAFDMEQIYVTNRDSIYEHEADRNPLFDLSIFENQCTDDAYGSSTKKYRPSNNLADSNAVASISNENLVCKAEVASFKMLNNNESSETEKSHHCHDHPFSRKVVNGKQPARSITFKLSKDNNIISKGKNVAVGESNHHRDYHFSLPMKEEAWVHPENRIKSSTVSSNRVQCDEAAGSKPHSSDIVKLPSQEPTVLSALPSCKPISPGIYLKSNELSCISDGNDKGNEIYNVVKAEPVDSFKDHSLDASANSVVAVVGSTELLAVETIKTQRISRSQV